MRGRLPLNWFPRRDASRGTKNPNGGYSLVELIAAVTILGIISAILTNFLQTSGLLYRRVTGNAKLQIQSQLFLSQIREYVIDANAGLYFDDTAGTLYVFSAETGGMYCHRFQFNSGDSMIYYSKSYPFALGEAVTYAVDSAELAGGVTDFRVLIDSPNVSGVKVSVVFQMNDASYQGELTVAPRNRPKTAADLNTLLDLLFD